MIIVLSGIVLIGLGLLYLVGKDTAWAWTEWSNRIKGVKSERTSQWDTFANIGGSLLIIIGVFLCFVAAMLQSEQNKRNLSGTTVTFTDSTGKKVERRLSKDEEKEFNQAPGRFLQK